MALASSTKRSGRAKDRLTAALVEPREPRPTDTITVLEGFDAMRLFLEAVWQRHGKAPEDIAFIVGASRWVDGTPVDPTMWEDWLMAVRMCRGLGRTTLTSVNVAVQPIR